MIKNINYLLLVSVALLSVSCSNDEFVRPDDSGNRKVQINVNLPLDISTRANGVEFGSGTASKKLNYAVYEVGTNDVTTFSFSGLAEFGNAASTTLSLNLLDKKYKIAFFAQSEVSMGTQSESGVYTFMAQSAGPAIVVDYAKMTGTNNNSDEYDCFYNFENIDLTGTNPVTTINVQLYRPVAQVTWGTNDIAATEKLKTTFGDEGQYIQTALRVDDLPTTLDLFSGITSGSFTGFIGGESGNTSLPVYFAKPVGTYPVEGYDYLGVQYILVGAPQKIFGVEDQPVSLTTNFEFYINNQVDGNTAPEYITTIDIKDVRLQSNFRTNIYGALLNGNTSAQLKINRQ